MKQKEGYEKYKQLIENASERWNMSKELICAFCMTESSFDEKAKRYEPKFYERYIKKMNLKEEEATWRSTSWGLMQVMGQVARENGYRGYRDDLVDPVINLYYCCKLFIKLLNRYKGNKEDAIAAYNQGNNRWKDTNRDGIKDSNEEYWNQRYVNKILAYEKEFIEIIKNETTEKVDDTTETYIIQSGDNLSKISKKFNTTVEKICVDNNIDNPDRIYPGQKLLILKK